MHDEMENPETERKVEIGVNNGPVSGRGLRGLGHRS